MILVADGTSPDGPRFLMVRENSASQVVHVENGVAELLAKARQYGRSRKGAGNGDVGLVVTR